MIWNLGLCRGLYSYQDCGLQVILLCKSGIIGGVGIRFRLGLVGRDPDTFSVQ